MNHKYVAVRGRSRLPLGFAVCHSLPPSWVRNHTGHAPVCSCTSSREGNSEHTHAIIAAQQALGHVYGDEGDGYVRWRSARTHADSRSASTIGELTYGELDVELTCRALEVAGLQDGERFVDIGSGYGRVVCTTALLYPQLDAVIGIEVVPELHSGARDFEQSLRQYAERCTHPLPLAPIEWFCNDYRDVHLEEVLRRSDVALCFATTWGSVKQLVLDELSSTLANHMAVGRRAVIVDKQLCEEHGWMLMHRFDAVNEATDESTVSVYHKA